MAKKRRDLRAQGCCDGDGGARWQCVYRRQRLRRDGKGRFRRCADGVIAGLLALGFSEDEAAALGVFLHGRAGAAAACKKGEHSVLARDIADCLLEKID